MKLLKQAVDFDQDETLEFQHCGKLVKQLSDGTIEVSQSLEFLSEQLKRLD